MALTGQQPNRINTVMTSFIAQYHDQLEVTGLSHEFGGWIARRPFRYLDPIYPGAFADARVQLHQKIKDLHASNAIRLAALPGDYVRPHANECEKGPLAADRVKAILWGTAIGDALGNTSESMTASDRRRGHGEIRHYLPNPHAGEQRIGLPSDDTQLTVWTLEVLLEKGDPDLQVLARAYRDQRIFGIGRTMRQFFRDLEKTGTSKEKVWLARQHRAGNGALMRVAGAFLPHAWTLDAGLLDTVAITSAFTHDDPSSTAACVAFARILADLLYLKKPVADGWFCEAFLETAGPIEGSVKLPSRVPGDSFEGSVCDMVKQRVMPALKEEGLSVSTACDRWYSGAFLLETVPSILYILERYKSDPQEAIRRAVMDTWDNDTVAAIVGAVMGAMHGMEAFATAWLECLPGRTTEDDDGRLDRVYSRLRALGGSGLND